MKRGKPYITEDKNYNGKIFWSHCLTECFEGSNKLSMDYDTCIDELNRDDKYITVELGMRDKLI